MKKGQGRMRVKESDRAERGIQDRKKKETGEERKYGYSKTIRM